MEFKINISQIIGAVIQAAAYIIFFLTVTWRASKRVNSMETKIELALMKIGETNDRMEKTFDRVDSTFDKMNDKLDRKEDKRGRT